MIWRCGIYQAFRFTGILHLTYGCFSAEKCILLITKYKLICINTGEKYDSSPILYQIYVTELP